VKLMKPSSNESMLWQGDSLARISQRRQLRVQALMDRRVACGPSSIALFAIFDHATCSWRTPPQSLLLDLIASPGSWPRSGTTRNGIAYQQQPLVRPISEIGSIYLPTPVATDTGHQKKPYSQGGRSLSFMLGGFPNPRFVEWMMGYPDGWTDLEDSETPSSPRLSNTSEG
jgi:hypothetical protein